MVLEILKMLGCIPTFSDKLNIFCNGREMWSLRSRRMCVGMLFGPDEFETLNVDMKGLISLSLQSLKQNFEEDDLLRSL